MDLCEAPGGVQASWGGDSIVFATGAGRVLQRVAASGGLPQPLTSLDLPAGDLAHTFPHALPRGNAVLFTIVRAGERLVALLRLDRRGTHVLTNGSQPRFVHGGFLVFVRDDTLWAARFDERRLELAGEPVPVVDGLHTAGGSAAHFAVSTEGTLMYAPRLEEPGSRSGLQGARPPRIQLVLVQNWTSELQAELSR